MSAHLPKKNAFFRSTAARIGAFSVAFALAIGLFSSSESYAVYNDYRYDEYQNMEKNSSGHARYIVPNLYRQDASYNNVKDFPLVVSNETEYVPIELFAQYSYLELVYGKNSYSFYINNTNNGRYVVFDLTNKTATSYDGELTDAEAKLYYRTYYVPAREVCEALNLIFESYDNEADGIRAARISDTRAKYTLDELVAMYSPVKKDPNENTSDSSSDMPLQPSDNVDKNNEKEETSPPKKDSSADKNENEKDKIKIEKPDEDAEEDSEEDSEEEDKADPSAETDKEAPDPYKNVSERKLYLTFEDQPNAETETLLEALKKERVKAVFFVEKERILEYPELVRKMMTDGHTIGLSIQPGSGQTVLSNEELCALLEETQESLKLVTKSETRLVRLAPGYTKALSENGFAAYASEHGYRLYDSTLRAPQAQKELSATEALCAELAENAHVKRTEHIGFTAQNASGDTITQLLAFCRKYKQFHILDPNEMSDLPSLLED